jgi:hypothetical protein
VRPVTVVPQGRYRKIQTDLPVSRPATAVS